MREEQAIFRVGKYGISQVPLNVIVGEYTLITSGKEMGTEKIKYNSQSYHKNYECALSNLLDRIIADKMAESNVDMIRSLIDSIALAKKEVLYAWEKK
jgi:hypothetical protein